MKKFIFGLLILLFPIFVDAETILDDYKVDVVFNDKEVHVSESFKVVSTEKEYITLTKKLFAYDTNVESDILDYNVVYEEKNHPYIVGDVSEDAVYHISYTIDDFTVAGTLGYEFFPPFEATINNLRFVITSTNSTLGVYGYKDGLYQLSKITRNAITGTLVEPTDNAHFMVNAVYNASSGTSTPDISQIFSEDGISLNELFPNLFAAFQSDRVLRISICTLIIAVVVGLILALSHFDNKKPLLIIYALTVFAMIVFQFILSGSYFALALLLFYGIFYAVLYSNKTTIPTELVYIFLVCFIGFHSYFFIGAAIGIVPHILNNLAIYVSSLIFRKCSY